jgi:hypothetical protein
VSDFVNVSSWPKADKQGYFGVRLSTVPPPILLAVDRSELEGSGRFGRKTGTDVHGGECRYRADYTAAPDSRFQKEPIKSNETRTNDESKSRKRKR